MDPVTMAIVGSLVSAGAGAIGNWLAGSSDAEEKRQRLQALREYSTIAPPEHRELVAREVARSRMADVQRDAGLEATQDEVMGRTLDIARNGQSAQGAADYEQSAQDSAQLARSNRMGAVANASAQGLGPEAAFTDSLMAGQGDADRERMAGLQRAASNEDARANALNQAGGMAAQRSSTRWNQDAEVAQAEDEFAKFNVGQWNEMQRYNRDDEFNVFDAKMSKADRMYGARSDIADMEARRGTHTRNQAAGIGSGLNRAITAPGIYGAGAKSTAPAAPTASSYRPTPASPTAPEALAPAMDQQRQIQTGAPTTTATRRRAR